MQTLVIGMIALCLTGCASTYEALPDEELPQYGEALPGTIHVTALQGFKRPGHYHLPKGATLGLLIDSARLKPFEWGTINPRCWQFIAVQMPGPAKKCRRINREGQAGLRILPEDRNLRLQDGQCVTSTSITW